MINDNARTLDLLANTDEVRLTAALERLRLHRYPLWKTLQEYQRHPERLEAWRKAPERSEERRKAIWFDEALKLLRIALGD